MSIYKNLESKIKKIIESAGYNVDELLLKESDRLDLGEYQLNDAFKLAKTYKENPMEIAEKIKNELEKNSIFKEVSVVKPGFINLKFSDSFLIDVINNVNNDIYSNIDKEESKKVIIDYGGANVAKSLHVGHLRSANIGQGIYNLAKTLGNNIISDAHLGDFGRPLGLVILEIRNRYPNLEFFNENYKGDYSKLDLPITNKDLEEIYPCASIKANESEEYLNEARKITNFLQHKKPGYFELWKKIIDISKEDIRKTYKKINVDFDYYYGESDAIEYLNELNKIVEENNLLKDSDGAKIIEVAKENDNKPMPPIIYVRGNDSLSYETTDMLTILQRKKEFNPDEIWYVVDKRQELHFEQVFRAVNLAHIVNEKCNLEFIGFGTMNGKDKKPFKTRDGGVLSLKELINLVYESTYKRLNPSITDEKEKENIASILAISAIKYSDLLSYRQTDYIFDIDSFTSLDGKTAPYILYTTIRAKSILNKVGNNNYNCTKINSLSQRQIALQVLKLSKVLTESYKQKSLNEICEYIYKLSSLFNNFYQENNIINEKDLSIKNSYLTLTSLIYNLNIFLLNILGIEVPEKM